MASSDPLDDVFTIEDQFYTQGYNAGLADGVPAGRAEGRSLGMQKGYEKFSEASRLAARAVLWANRFPSNSTSTAPASQSTQEGACKLPKLAAAGGPRLEKNVKSVYALLEPGTLSTKNEDEAVQDFDDRLRRAQGKVKIVERMLGTGATGGKRLGSPPVQQSS